MYDVQYGPEARRQWRVLLLDHAARVYSPMASNSLNSFDGAACSISSHSGQYSYYYRYLCATFTYQSSQRKLAVPERVYPANAMTWLLERRLC
jgi:hypothetical protein